MIIQIETIQAIYKSYLVFILPFTTSIGMFAGFEAAFNSQCRYNNENNFFTYMIGYTSVGFLTGLFYPITFPMFALKIINSSLSQKY